MHFKVTIFQRKQLKLQILSSLLSMRFDSFLREPWSTMIMPSLSPTPCGSSVKPPFPFLKLNLLLKLLPLEGSPVNFEKLRSDRLEGLVPVWFNEQLQFHQEPKPKTIIHNPTEKIKDKNKK